MYLKHKVYIMKLDSFYHLMDELTLSKIPYLFLLDFESQSPLIIPLSELMSSEALVRFHFPTESNDSFFSNLSSHTKKENCIEPHYLSFTAYSDKLTLTKELFVKYGVDVINLTQPTAIKVTNSLEEIYQQASSKYKVFLKDRFISFSPETFVQINEDGIISCFPMKGTIDASIPNARDLVLNNKKEEEEHRATVNSIISELELVSNDVRVSRYRYIDKLSTSNKSLFQVSSEIQGELKNEFKRSFGQLFTKLLPAGSIVGAPKQKALDIISQVEGYTRGYYTGVCGVYNGKTLDSCVLIRFIEQTPNGFVYKSGGGVTLSSDALTEYNEIKDKIYVPLD